MFEIYDVTGSEGGENFLIKIDEKYVLIDAGFGFAAKEMILKVMNYVKGDGPEFLLLTHSHYDHAMGSPEVKRAFPNIKIVAHKHAATIFAKDSAHVAMCQLDNEAAVRRGVEPCANIPKLKVDIEVSGGECLQIEKQSIKIIEAAGHTNCSIAYFFPSENLLVMGESAGCIFDPPVVVPEFIVSYNDAIETIERIKNINPEHILLPHYGIVSGHEARDFITQARTAAFEMKNLIIDLSDSGASIDEIAQMCKKRYFIGTYARLQPESAFMLNRLAMIKKLIAARN